MSKPTQIRMGGYGPATTGFSRALKLIGDRLTAAFGDRLDVKYVWNIMDLGYRAEDILWLVEDGLADPWLSVEQLSDRSRAGARPGRSSVSVREHRRGARGHRRRARSGARAAASRRA